MKQETLSTKKIRTWAYISPTIKEILTQRAHDEHNSESEIITKALTMYLTKDVTDESELIAKMSEIIRVVENNTTKIDLGQKLGLEFLQYYIMTAPELPKDEKEAKWLQERAAKRTQKFLLSFRRRLKLMPSLLETILGNMLEEDVPAQKGRT
jgi:hypothetical protein